jgi:hypothetical protein
MVDSLEAEKVVLENWKKERAQLDAAIAMLESKIGARAAGGLPPLTSASHIASDAFFRMTVPDAIKKFLKMVGKPARPATDIVDTLNRGGISVSYPTVYTSLTRLRDKGEVVKAGENWGLDEWYPPAPSKVKAVTENSHEADAVIAEKEQPKPTGELERVEVAETKSRRAKGDGRKKEIADFIRVHGPSTRTEILAGTSVPDGSFSYCMNDSERFVKGDDGKWRNFEG